MRNEDDDAPKRRKEAALSSLLESDEDISSNEEELMLPTKRFKKLLRGRKYGVKGFNSKETPQRKKVA